MRQVTKRIVKLIGLVLLINFLSVQQNVAQAPDCDQCDYLIEDPIAYAECVQDFCNDSIPINEHLWILIIGGVGMSTYAFYQYNGHEKKTVDI